MVGSREEMQRRAVAGWSEFAGHSPHRPWVDKIQIACGKCGKPVARIPDVGNPWLDAGIVPYSTMGYNKDREFWKQWFPADFITESFPGQFRNWFYAILAMSTMMENKPPFKNLLGHAQVRDQRGELMSKSKGNSIEFNGAANDGYELFHDREPKLTVENDAKKNLPEGFKKCAEREVVIDGKPKVVVAGQYPPIGADVIRWLYCRTNPAQNINFGPGPANEIRAKFHLKLWNSYAFFCNYARLDGFDPSKPEVPAAERPDIDRWIISDLQLLIKKARESFESYNVMAFCLEAERFVDEKLSNWYIRRNRRRFWKGDKGKDKDAAYQTLYTVLKTFTQLCAPVIPFQADVMWRNLRMDTDSLSVHLCDYPQANEKLLDAQLSRDMEALLDLVTLGSAARNAARIRVRQPLAEIRVQPADEAGRNALQRFGDQLCDELNIRKAALHEGNSLLKIEVKPNRKSLGPKAGAHLQEICTAIEKLNPASLKFPMELPLASGPFTLEAADVILTYTAAEGWAGAADKGTQVAIDTRLTDDLKRAGLAREVVRCVQEQRKKAGLEMEDRIVLCLKTDSPELKQAIDSHRDYIAAETLTTNWADSLPNETEVKIEGATLKIGLSKV